MGKPDLAPMAWERRFVIPFVNIQLFLEELGQSSGNMFERFEMDPLKSDLINRVPHTHTTYSPIERNIYGLFTPLLVKGMINVPIMPADN